MVSRGLVVYASIAIPILLESRYTGDAMSKAATTAFNLLVTGTADMRFNLGPFTNAASPGQLINPSLSQGDNSLTVPSGTQYLVFNPQTAGVLTVRGSMGDTGIKLSTTLPSFIPTAANVIVNVTQAGTLAQFGFGIGLV
jgi:hypothetical protein